MDPLRSMLVGECGQFTDVELVLFTRDGLVSSEIYARRRLVITTWRMLSVILRGKSIATLSSKVS